MSAIATELFKVHAASAAKGVAVLATRAGTYDVAITVSDYLMVSWEPPTISVSLYTLGRAAEAVERSGKFMLSLLGADQRAIAARLGQPSPPLHGLLSGVEHFRRAEQDPVIIAGALAWFEVSVDQSVEAATHTLYIGRVTAAGAQLPPAAQDPAAAEQVNFLEPNTAGPLLRYQHSYYRASEIARSGRAPSRPEGPFGNPPA